MTIHRVNAVTTCLYYSGFNNVRLNVCQRRIIYVTCTYGVLRPQQTSHKLVFDSREVNEHKVDYYSNYKRSWIV